MNFTEIIRQSIDSLLRNVLSGFESELRKALDGYDGFPDSVKLALLDMAYNLGPAGLLHGYPRMIHAVEAGNWAQAAANCERVRRHIFRDARARADVRTITQSERRNQGGIAADEDPFANLGAVFSEAVVIAGDAAGADI